MLQRYDIKVDGDTNRLSINEYAVLGRRYRRYGMQEPATPATIKYNLVYEASYEGDNIRTAIKQGRTALISELRTDGFFPVQACAELLAEKVTDLFDAGADQFVELFYDDRTAILPEDTDEGDE
jgi:hypothetical protein